VLEARGDRVRRTATVHEDWVAWLPDAKDHAFAFTTQELEASYISLSVTLNDALTLCKREMLLQAREQGATFADLFDRLAGGSRAVLRAMHEHGQQFGTLPNFALLRSDYFRSERARQIARTNSLFSFLILRSRKRFFRKLAAAEQIMADLNREVRNLTRRMSGENGLIVDKGWGRLEVLHYDMNTCLRETTVMLKSFFCVLPPNELEEFRKRLFPVLAAAVASRLAEPRLTTLVRPGQQPAARRAAAGGDFPGTLPLQPQSHLTRDNSGSEDGIPSKRMRPDGTSGSNETN
jgi:hypothetical protein